MAYKGILKIFLITIFLIGTISFAYADSGPTIGENQVKTIAKEYLNSHNLPYKVTTATWMVKIINRKTGNTKWVSWDQWGVMTGDNKFKPDDPTFEWDYVQTGSNTAWKVNAVNSQGDGVGNIWINDETGKVFKTDLKPVNTQNTTTKNNTDSNIPITSNITSPTPQDTSGNNTWIILGAVLLVVILGAGYWFYSRR